MDNTEILKWNQRSKLQKHHFFLPSPSLRALIEGQKRESDLNDILYTWLERSE